MSATDLRAYYVYDDADNKMSDVLLLTPEGFANLVSDLPTGWHCDRVGSI